MDKEERDLQIKLAKLQTDAQISLAYSLAYFAICGGLLIAFFQIALTSIGSDLEGFKNYAIVTLFFLMVAFSILGFYNINKMNKYRDEMDKL